MFGKKKKLESQLPVVAVTTIPQEFYGGKNPVVKFKETKKEIDTSVLENTPITQADKKLHQEQTSKTFARSQRIVGLLSSRKFLLISGLGVVGIMGVSITIMYLPTLFKKAPKTPAPPSMSTSSIATTDLMPASSTIEIPMVTSTTSSTSQVAVLARIDFPSLLLGDSQDTDNDGLSDREEEDVFATDPGVPDTDNDGYQDGHEAYYLYNPSGKEPERLLASGLVKEFDNPVLHYMVYRPAKWAEGNVDNEYRDMLWTTLTGESVEMREVDKKASQSFDEWFAEWAPKEKRSDLIEFTTYFSGSGFRRTDYLVYYFPVADKVYVLLYRPAPDSSTVNFRSVIKTMARSFRVPKSVANQLLPLVPLIASSSTTSSTSSMSTSTISNGASSTVPQSPSTPNLSTSTKAQNVSTSTASSSATPSSSSSSSPR